MRYFVTGATGFIGGSLMRQLIAAGHQVVALARDPVNAADLVKAGAETSSGAGDAARGGRIDGGSQKQREGRAGIVI